MEDVTGCLSGLRVLVVEDEPVLGLFFDDLLEAEGCQIFGRASNVEMALDLLRHDAPDGVVLDLNLNGVRSLPVADFLIERNVPFVIVSGCSRDEVCEPSLQAAPFLEKPFRAHALVNALAEAIKQSPSIAGLQDNSPSAGTFAGGRVAAR
jgi:CheY-like chemotaxis protein